MWLGMVAGVAGIIADMQGGLMMRATITQSWCNSQDFVYCGPANDTVNNMPGPSPAESFAGDCEEFVY